jgi:hypothetical protein
MLAEMIAATLNINHIGGTNISIAIERTLIQWMRQLFSFPEDNGIGGIVVSGTSLATIICMTVVRKRAVINVKQNGVSQEPQFVAYASTETHNCVVKAFELLELEVCLYLILKVVILFQVLNKLIHSHSTFINGFIVHTMLGCVLIRDVNLFQSIFNTYNAYTYPNQREFLARDL